MPTQLDTDLARLAAYGVDYAEGLDPYTAGWVNPDGSYRFHRFPIGSWVTPRADSGLARAGEPHLVIDALVLTNTEPLFGQAPPLTRADGLRRDMRVVTIDTKIAGPAPVWVESIDFEAYAPPPGVTLPAGSP